MRISISRGIALGMAFAALGLAVACAPKSNPEPYPTRTAESTPAATETPATAETAPGETPAAGDTAAAPGETPAAGETAAAPGETPAAGETPTAGENKSADAAVKQDSPESVAKAKADTQAAEKKARTAATWEFVITDTALTPTDPKPVLVDDVTFKVVNKASEDYIFKLEGINIEPTTVAAGKEATFGSEKVKFGPGGIVASVVKASSDNKNAATRTTRFDIQAPK